MSTWDHYVVVLKSFETLIRQNEFLINVHLPFVESASLKMKSTNLCNKIFWLPFKKKKKTYRLPWNLQTPRGYIGEILFSIGVCEAYLAFNGTILLMFVSICWHHRAFYKIFQNSLQKFDESVEKQNPKKILSELVSFHNSAKR